MGVHHVHQHHRPGGGNECEDVAVSVARRGLAELDAQRAGGEGVVACECRGRKGQSKVL